MPYSEELFCVRLSFVLLLRHDPQALHSLCLPRVLSRLGNVHWVFRPHRGMLFLWPPLPCSVNHGVALQPYSQALLSAFSSDALLRDTSLPKLIPQQGSLAAPILYTIFKQICAK